MIPEREEAPSPVKEPLVSHPSGTCPECLTEVAARRLLAKEPALTSMSLEFFLQPLDGGPPVPVGPGQTVIGRGPLLGVSVRGARAAAVGSTEAFSCPRELHGLVLLVRILQFGGSTFSVSVSQLTDISFWCP